MWYGKEVNPNTSNISLTYKNLTLKLCNHKSCLPYLLNLLYNNSPAECVSSSRLSPVACLINLAILVPIQASDSPVYKSIYWSLNFNWTCYIPRKSVFDIYRFSFDSLINLQEGNWSPQGTSDNLDTDFLIISNSLFFIFYYP